MVASVENEQIKEGSGELFIFLMSIAAEIKPLAVANGLEYNNGIILFSEDAKMCSRIQRELLNVGAVMCKSISKIRQKVGNNKIGFHIYNLYDKKEDVWDFLGLEGFTPMVLLYGVIPDFVKNGNLVPYESSKHNETGKIMQCLPACKEYIHKNPLIVQKQIDLYKSSDYFLENVDIYPVKVILGVAAEVYYNFYRETHSESESRQERRRLHDNIEFILNRAECYTDECETLTIVQQALLRYVDENPHILITEVDNIGREASEAIQRSEAILFDKEWYYFPDDVLRAACSDFLDIISIPQVKQELFESGVLYSKNREKQNFTDKKLLTNIYGYKFRKRFLKVKKEFLCINGELNMEERGAL